MIEWLNLQLRIVDQNAQYDDSQPSRLKIARMDLVFDNAEMIDLLLQRGQAIKYKDKEKIQRLEVEIN